MSLPPCPTCGGPEGAAALVEAEGRRLGAVIVRGLTGDGARDQAIAERDRLLAEAWAERDAALEERDRLRAVFDALGLVIDEVNDAGETDQNWAAVGAAYHRARAGTGEGGRG